MKLYETFLIKNSLAGCCQHLPIQAVQPHEAVIFTWWRGLYSLLRSLKCKILYVYEAYVSKSLSR